MYCQHDGVPSDCTRIVLQVIPRGMSADKLKKGDVGLKDIFLSESFHQCTIHIHSFITEDMWNGKLRKLINNAVKTQLTKNVKKEHLNNLKHFVEIKAIYIFKTYPYPIISKKVLLSYFTAFY